jgi:N-formylglutamate amidohydrolase
MSPQSISFAPVTVNRAAVPSPVIVSIPHAGRIYPQEILDEARVPQTVLEQFEDRWSDLIARKAQAEGATIVTARYARAVADCNRAEQQMASTDVANDLRGQMNAVGVKERAGLGVVPTRLGTAGVLWRRPIDRASWERRLNMIHRPYHRAIDQQITCALHQHGYAVLIDLHSMPSISANRVGHGQKLIVGDLFGASGADWLTGAAIAMGQYMGLSVGLNRPYAGGHILERHAAPKRHIYGVQLEWDRTLYLTPNGDPRITALMELEKIFADFAALVSRGDPRHHPMNVAAE